MEWHHVEIIGNIAVFRRNIRGRVAYKHGTMDEFTKNTQFVSILLLVWRICSVFIDSSWSTCSNIWLHCSIHFKTILSLSHFLLKIQFLKNLITLKNNSSMELLMISFVILYSAYEQMKWYLIMITLRSTHHQCFQFINWQVIYLTTELIEYMCNCIQNSWYHERDIPSPVQPWGAWCIMSVRYYPFGNYKIMINN